MARSATFHRAGHLKQAEAGYRLILRRMPGHAEANHNLGVLLLGRGQADAGLAFLEKAQSAEPGNAQYRRSYAEALIRAGRPAQLVSSQAAVERLAELYTSRRFGEVIAMAREILTQDSDNGFMWKVLGAALHELGDVSASLGPKQISVLLDPGNAENHNNLSFSLKDLQRFAEAAASAHRALTVRPKFDAAHNNLSLALAKQEEWKGAKASGKAAVLLSPGNADYHNTMGLSLMKERSDWGAASIAYDRAIRLNPQDHRTYNNRAVLLRALNRGHEAETELHRAVALYPGFAEAQLNFAYSAWDRSRPDHALRHFSRAAETSTDGVAYDAHVYLGVLRYLREEVELARQQLSLAFADEGRLGKGSRPAQIYWIYLQSLLPLLPGDIAEESETLFVLGESHSLGLHCQPVQLAGRSLVGRAEWIAGCKQWHLANQDDNRYKRFFAAAADRLPPGSLVLTTIGEIDCRSDEGIFPLSRRKGGKDRRSLIEATVGGFIAWVRRHLSDRGHRVIVAGVPCPNRKLDLPSDQEVVDYLAFLDQFNQRLKQECAREGMAFLDLHALTNRGDGRANGDWHIDGHHLRPDAWRAAFERHLLGEEIL